MINSKNNPQNQKAKLWQRIGAIVGKTTTTRRWGRGGGNISTTKHIIPDIKVENTNSIFTGIKVVNLLEKRSESTRKEVEKIAFCLPRNYGAFFFFQSALSTRSLSFTAAVVHKHCALLCKIANCYEQVQTKAVCMWSHWLEFGQVL